MAKIIFSSILVLLVLGQESFFSQDGDSRDELFKSQKKIKLFVTTREEVEKEFDYKEIQVIADRSNGILEVVYYFEDGSMRIDYSTGKCAEHNSKLGYNVGKNIAIETDLFFYNPIDLSRLGFEMDKFEVYVEPESGAFIYYDGKRGVQIDGGDDFASGIQFEPTEEQEEKLRCENVLSAR